jgi:hypothetical protein
MFEFLSERLAQAGALGYPLLLLGLACPVLCPGSYIIGALLKNKVWALRFGVLNLALGVALPLICWVVASMRLHAAVEEIRQHGAPADLELVELAARGEMLALPWLSLLSSPWLVATGFALLGVSLLRHPALARAPAGAVTQ